MIVYPVQITIRTHFENVYDPWLLLTYSEDKDIKKRMFQECGPDGISYLVHTETLKCKCHEKVRYVPMKDIVDVVVDEPLSEHVSKKFMDMFPAFALVYGWHGKAAETCLYIDGFKTWQKWPVIRNFLRLTGYMA